MALTQTAPEDVHAGDTVLVDGVEAKITEKRFVAGKDVPDTQRRRGAFNGYLFYTDHGDLFTSPIGFLEVVGA
jgi:hypothetical protein